MTDHKILLVDDEPAILEALSLVLGRQFSVLTANSGKKALKAVDEQFPDIVLLDVMMPKIDGIKTLELLKEKNPNLPVIMLTASNRVKDAVQAMKLGAVDYLSKPFDIDKLIEIIIHNLNFEDSGKERSEKKYEIIGNSIQLNEVLDQINLIGKSNVTVLITGESGTGKELIARKIHSVSDRASKNFCAINCAAIPASLIESELFGHEKGAFTGAEKKHIGYFEQASGGTIFLDEIGDLDFNVQVKLLRVLQEQEISRVGSSKSIKIDVRVLAATNKNLSSLVEQKLFRGDLYYRLNVINLELPTLRKRLSDIPLLINHFTDKFSNLYGREKLTFLPEALKMLSRYDWPGNIRELENVVESIVALSKKDEISIEELPPKVRKIGSADSSMTQNLNFYKAESEFQKEFIVRVLNESHGSVEKAAEIMGVSKRLLREKMEKLGIG